MENDYREAYFNMHGKYSAISEKLFDTQKENADLKDKLHRRNKTTDNLRAEIKQLKSEVAELHCFCQNDLCEQCTTEYMNTQQTNR